MALEVYFNRRIKEKIIEELESAKSSIYVAMAFFTDRDLLKIILQKINEGLIVHLVIDRNIDLDELKEDIKNNITREPKSILVSLLELVNGTQITKNESALIYQYSPYDKNAGMMHHKFCIIDLNIVITGSYNWTNSAANKNQENIIIIKNDKQVIQEYVNEFEELQKKTLLTRLSDIRYSFKIVYNNKDIPINSSATYLWSTKSDFNSDNLTKELLEKVNYDVIDEVIICNFNYRRNKLTLEKGNSQIYKLQVYSLENLVLKMRQELFDKKRRVYIVDLITLLKEKVFSEPQESDKNFSDIYRTVIYKLKKYSREFNVVFWLILKKDTKYLLELENFPEEEILSEMIDVIIQK